MASLSARVRAISPSSAGESGFDFIVITQAIVAEKVGPDFFEINSGHAHEVLNIGEISKPPARIVADGLEFQGDEVLRSRYRQLDLLHQQSLR